MVAVPLFMWCVRKWPVRFLSLFFNLLEPVFKLGQRWLGTSRLGWLFVGPNLIVFGLFTFLPILIKAELPCFIV